MEQLVGQRRPTAAEHGGRQPPVSVLGVALDPQSWLSVAFLLLACPLGVCAGLVLLVVAVGLALAPVVVGLPILALGLRGTEGFAGLERTLAALLLGEPLAPAALPPAPPRVRWRRFRACQRVGGRTRLPGLGPATAWPEIKRRLGRPATYAELLYLVVKLPLALLSAALVLGAAGFGLRLLAAPLIYRAAVMTWPVPVDELGAALGCALAGLVVLLFALHLANTLAEATGSPVRHLLGPADGGL